MRCGRREITKSLILLPLGYIFANALRPTIVTTTAFITPIKGGLLAVFTLSKPNGVVVTQSGVTDDIGRAEVRFQLKRKDPSGVYKGTVTIAGVMDEELVLI